MSHTFYEKKMRWERVHVQQTVANGGGGGGGGPGIRWGHTCNSVKGGRFLYVFGGYGKDNCQTNQIHVFDTVQQTWTQPVIKGAPPLPRDSHTCTAVGDNLFVFGGTDGMNPLNDLHILDTSLHTWVSPSIRGEAPEAREGHSAAVVGKRLYIFGGCGKYADTKSEVYYNDLYILNTETFVWKLATTSGISPSARDSHTCSSWNNKIVVIGGEDGHDYYLSDVHILDTETLAWKTPITTGQKLPPRAGHTTIAMGKNLFVFGGFTDAQNLYDDLYVLDVETGIWTKLMAIGEGPSARFSAAGDCLDPRRGGAILLMGGCNKNLEALDDMYYLHTGLSSLQVEQGIEKLSMRKQLKLKCQEQTLNSPFHDKALVSIDTNTNFRYSMPSDAHPSWQIHQGKKIFHARVTESLPLGYKIETLIDGKPLQGILFVNRPSNFPLTDYSNSRKRKRVGGEVGLDSGVSNGDFQSKSKTLRISKEDVEDQSQHVNVRKEDLAPQETNAEPGAAPMVNEPAGSNVSQVPENPEPAITPTLNLNAAIDAPNTELLKENSSTTNNSFSLLNQVGTTPPAEVEDPNRSI